MDTLRCYLGGRAYKALCWTSMVSVSLAFTVGIAGLGALQMVLVGTALECVPLPATSLPVGF